MKRRGVTLIELVVALALSVLLVMTTAGVIKSMQQKKKVFADRIDVQPWQVELADRLRDDILQAKEMRVENTSLALLGFCGHDPTTGEPTQTLVQVDWRLKRKDGYDILTRTETSPNGTGETSMRPLTELMAIGVTNISIGTFSGEETEEKTEMQAIATSERTHGEPGDWATMPKVLKLIVLGPKNVTLVDELIYR